MQRSLRREQLHSEVLVVGGGLSGVCCAITAARQGRQVLLVQDRPVLGGNASSEVRLWILGATSHMGNNNRWAREGGVIDELLVENMWRNPEGNPVILDSILLELVSREAKLTLLLNTAVQAVAMEGDKIRSVQAFCSQNETAYDLHAPFFVDASGDGVVGFLSGAEFCMGAEGRAEFDEGMAPPEPTQHLLGHSLYFYSRDTGKPVRFVPPAFALKDIQDIPRYRELRVSDSGCRLWWLEYGGNLDTIAQTEEIKWELWRVAYGVWNYIKNSGEFPEADTLTLEWMGTIPGKRESRRFVGDTMMTQADIVEQRTHKDAVSFGGWAIDLHPADGVYSAQPGCIQWHSKGVYQIPYRAMYSRNVANLFLTGRLISASHVAFGSTRVMATCAHNGQAVGVAAAICSEEGLLPRDLTKPSRMLQLQQRLLRSGQYIPGVRAQGADDLAIHATVTASSTFQLAALPASGESGRNDVPYALLLPVAAGPMPQVTLFARVSAPTVVKAELWASARLGNTTPDLLLAVQEVSLAPGEDVPISLQFDHTLAQDQHVFVMVHPFVHGTLRLSRAQIPGVLTLSQKGNAAVAKSAVQQPPEGTGVDSFAFWLPDRRPAARNLAASLTPPLNVFQPANVSNGLDRPWCGVNAWVPAADDPEPTLQLRWPAAQTVSTVEIVFDTDFDHPMESVLMTHPEHVMPGCVTAFALRSAEGEMLAHVTEHHQTRFVLHLSGATQTCGLDLQLLRWGPAPPAIFAVRCF